VCRAEGGDETPVPLTDQKVLVTGLLPGKVGYRFATNQVRNARAAMDDVIVTMVSCSDGADLAACEASEIDEAESDELEYEAAEFSSASVITLSSAGPYDSSTGLMARPMNGATGATLTVTVDLGQPLPAFACLALGVPPGNMAYRPDPRDPWDLGLGAPSDSHLVEQDEALRTV